MNQPKPDAMREVVQMVAELQQENMALRLVCANLLGEIALLHKDPPAHLGKMTAGMSGVADAIASKLRQEFPQRPETTAVLSKAIDEITSMAEAALVRKPLPPSL